MFIIIDKLIDCLYNIHEIDPAITNTNKEANYMRLKKIIQWFLKVFISGTISIIILSAFSLLYYNNGIRKTSSTGVTDYSWSNRFYSIGYEGFAAGMYDKDGYNNSNSIPKDDIDILLMGSSQMNAYNVTPQHSTAYLLNNMMADSKLDYNLYNIGMEGHDFYICSDNLDRALNVYAPKKYVLIETRTIKLSTKSMERVLTGTRTKTPAFDSGIVYYFQKVPYFRLMYRQLRDRFNMNDNSLNNAHSKDNSIDQNNTNTMPLLDDAYEQMLNRYLKNLEQIAAEHHVIPIIFYIPDIMFNRDGSMQTTDDIQDISFFSKMCDKHQIEFVDLTEPFLNNYVKNKIVPFGFSNTQIGAGHLNRAGHHIIAQSLFEKIKEIEGL